VLGRGPAAGRPRCPRPRVGRATSWMTSSLTVLPESSARAYPGGGSYRACWGRSWPGRWAAPPRAPRASGRTTGGAGERCRRMLVPRPSRTAPSARRTVSANPATAAAPAAIASARSRAATGRPAAPTTAAAARARREPAAATKSARPASARRPGRLSIVFVLRRLSRGSARRQHATALSACYTSASHCVVREAPVIPAPLVVASPVRSNGVPLPAGAAVAARGRMQTGDDGGRRSPETPSLLCGHWRMSAF
jgi:hypothetical protein